MTLLAFAVYTVVLPPAAPLQIRTEKRPRLLQTCRAAIDRYRLLAGPTAANPPHAVAAVDRRDRQTDGRRTVALTLPSSVNKPTIH